VLTNILPAKVSDTFSFYLYCIDSADNKNNLIESRNRRMTLFNKGFFDDLLADMPEKDKKELRKMVIFGGSFFYSARKIAALGRVKLPYVLCDGTSTNGDTMTCVRVYKFTTPLVLLPNSSPDAVARGDVSFDGIRCNNCTRTFRNQDELLQHFRDTGHTPIYGADSGSDEEEDASPASVEVFTSYVNMMLQRAMEERLVRWGREFVDKDAPIPGKDRNGNDLGISIFEAISLSFGIMKTEKAQPFLALTCDLRAKVIRTVSVHGTIYKDRTPGQRLTSAEQNQLKREWTGEVVIYKNDRKCK
jgi:hypothetical protein